MEVGAALSMGKRALSIFRHSTTIKMSTLRLAQPDPRPEALLAHARRIAKIALRSTDSITGDFLIEKAEEQYQVAIRAFDSKSRPGEASQARAELKQFSSESRFALHDAPVLLDGSAFRKAMDALAATESIGPYYNGTNDLEEIVNIARRRMAHRDRLGAAEDATRAATCLLWRAGREDEAISLYNEFTDALVRDVRAHLGSGLHSIVQRKLDIARHRLLLTDRRDEALELAKLVEDTSHARPMGTRV
jgi:hypothetical protein